MVKFGEWFYERIINFLIGSDKHPYIIQGTSSKPLPNGYRAHQMPEMVEIWIDELKNALQSPDEIFIEELQIARDLLNDQEFLNLADKVQLGIEKAFEAFKKWMITWTHLPFCICSLGGESGPEFAQAINHIILSYPLPDEPTAKLKKYVKQLEKNLEEGRSGSFGLFEALEQHEFREQFVAFSKTDYTQMQRFPLIYEFVKHRIWSIIVHQQHIEGMFNKYDIKTHPNMSESLQEARLQLSSPTPLDFEITKEKLTAIRMKRQKETSLSTDLAVGEEAAKKLAQSFLIPRRN